MKVFLACRAGSGSAFIAHSLQNQVRLDGLVIESGKDARARKIERLKRDTPIWRAPLVLADLLALAVYARLQGAYLNKFVTQALGTTSFPHLSPTLHVDDINEPACQALLQEHAPDILLVSGTALLTEEILSIANRYVLNIHGGIVPAYRNVQSELWAYINGDIENIGTSIIHLDAGIDTGDVAIQATVQAVGNESLFELKTRNLALAAALICDLLKNTDEDIPRVPQSENRAGFFPTPGTMQFLSLISRIVLNRCKRIARGSVADNDQTPRGA